MSGVYIDVPENHQVQSVVWFQREYFWMSICGVSPFWSRRSNFLKRQKKYLFTNIEIQNCQTNTNLSFLSLFLGSRGDIRSVNAFMYAGPSKHSLIITNF